MAGAQGIKPQSVILEITIIIVIPYPYVLAPRDGIEPSTRPPNDRCLRLWTALPIYLLLKNLTYITNSF